MKISHGEVSFTWEQVETDGGQALRVVVDDRRAPVRAVVLTLGDWAPGEPAPAVRTVEVEGVEADCRLPISEYVGAFSSAVAEMLALAGQGTRRRRQRTKLTDEFLREIVDIYRSAPKGERIAAVREAHPASESQVYRWLAAARGRGLMADGPAPT